MDNRNKDNVGKRVKNLHVFCPGFYMIPAGTVFTVIRRSYPLGYDITSDPHPKTGRVYKLQNRSLERFEEV